MDNAIQENILQVTRAARDRDESLAWFRVATGLHYLAALVRPEAIDFKVVDKAYNKFIYQAVGRGHSIASVLQFMSGARVVAVVDCERFTSAFAAHCPEVPIDTIGFLLSLNLGVAKAISKLDIGGPVLEWIEKQNLAAQPGDPALPGIL